MKKQIFCLSALLFVVVLFIVAPAKGSEIQLPADNGVIYNPAKQKPITHQMADGSVLQLAGGIEQHQLVITRPGMQPVSMELLDEIGHVASITSLANGQAAIIGDLGSGLSEVLLVDVSQYQIADKFMGYRPAPSPNGRFIAFIKFYPTHPGTDVSDIVLVYDATRSPSANRPMLNPRFYDIRAAVGMAVYPPGAKTQDSNMYLPNETDYYHVTSDFFWAPDSSRFAFAAEHAIPAQKKAYNFKKKQYVMPLLNSELEMVLVDISAPYAPKTSVSQVDVCGGSCLERVKNIEFGATGIKAEVKGFDYKASQHRKIQINYDQFR